MLKLFNFIWDRILLFFVLFVLLGTFSACTKNESNSNTKEFKNYEVHKELTQVKQTKVLDNIINIAIDDDIKWKPIIDANGGMVTKKGSIYDQLDLKVNISFIDDINKRKEAFENNEIDCIGCSSSELTVLNNKDIIVPFAISTSNEQYDVLIRTDIKNSITLFNLSNGFKIGANSSLNVYNYIHNLSDYYNINFEAAKSYITNNSIVYSSIDESLKSFFNHDIDIVIIPHEYGLTLTESNGYEIINTSNIDLTSSVNVSVKNKHINGIVFNKDFIKDNEIVITNFINGTLKANNNSDIKLIKNVSAKYYNLADDDIITEYNKIDYTSFSLANNLLTNYQNEYVNVLNIFKKDYNINISDLFTDYYINNIYH